MSSCHIPSIFESRDRSKHTRVVRLVRGLARRNYYREEYEEGAVVVEAENADVRAVMERSREPTHLLRLDG